MQRTSFNTVLKQMVNELRIPHVVVSLVYMIVQIVIIIGDLYCRGYGDWYLLGCILLLSGISVSYTHLTLPTILLV